MVCITPMPSGFSLHANNSCWPAINHVRLNQFSWLVFLLSLSVSRCVFRSPDSAMRLMVYAFLSLESVVFCSPVPFCFEFSIERVFVFVNLFTSFVHCLLCVVACCVCCQYECPMSISTQSSFDQHNNLSLCADDDQPLNLQYFFLLPPMGHSSPSYPKKDKV